MTNTLEKLLLKTIYSCTINKTPSTLSALSRLLELSHDILNPSLESLIEKNSIKIDSKNHYYLTDFGRKQLTVVMTGGTFDLLHTGHLYTLQQAKYLGDVLVVVIATNKTVEKMKNRPPTNDQKERARIISRIKEVDAVVLGSEKDFMVPIDIIKPDIIALGYDQFHQEEKLHQTLVSRGYAHTKLVRLKKHVIGKSTSKIVQDIIKHSYRNQKDK
ncbi:MAG: adenylyltransferase/cytidyltransferase family protein [Candidatus Thorarchaeota archaeon]